MNPRFLFNAHASGFAGRIRKPFVRNIDVQAPSALGVEGGYSSSRVENQRIGEVATIGAAFTQAAGTYSERQMAWETVVTSTVEKLNILDQLTADRVVARLTSYYPLDGGEPTILPLGSTFENLRIAGQPVEVDLSTNVLSELGKWSDLVSFLDARAEVRSLFDTDDDDLRAAPGKVMQARRLLFGTMVRGLKVEATTVKIMPGGVIYVPQFGRVHLAEIMITPDTRRVTMLRVELGSPVEGEFEAADVTGNGHRYPP